MKNKIFRYMLLISLICTMLLTVTLSFIFYGIISKQHRENLKSKANDIAFIMNSDIENINYLENTQNRERITLIGTDGDVIFDNYADASTLDNHGDRPEVSSAYSQSVGESDRYSKTLANTTYNYAIRLNSGEVLRVSIITKDISDIVMENFVLIIFVVVAILLITNIFAYKLTRKIIDPLNDIDFDENKYLEYYELQPFFIKITEQKQELMNQLDSIKYQNNAILTITENMKEGIILLDKNNSILTYNDSVCDIFEIDKSYIGNNVLNFFRYNDLIDSLKKLDNEGANFIFQKNKFSYNVSVSPVYKNKEIEGAVILLIDITEKVQLDKFRKEFSANVSHELKTPLMSILGYSELIENGMVQTEDINRFAKKIRKEATSMSGLVEDILLISQLDESANKDRENKSFERIDINVIINNVVDSLDSFIKKKNIDLVVNCNDVVFEVNEKLYSELVKNLVYNAINYNVENGKVKIDIWVENEKLHLRVEDTGLGIEKIHQARIFERFYRVEQSRDKRNGGTGLGLSIVKNVTLYHNGEIKLTSEIGKGSVFEVII